MFPMQLLHGGDYNPDQWLDCPEILEEDIRLMKEAHVNCVTLAVFAWSKLEPEEGVYDFAWLKEMIDRLYQNGIYTILATPTGAMPHWMTQKYEEVLQVENNGMRRLSGMRHNFCPSSPVMRQKMRAIDGRLSAAFGQHPGVIAWHISNEYGGVVGRETGCHCPYCQEAFRGWLKHRYQTLERLNQAWWTSFWSNTFTSWEQIHSPSPIGEDALNGLKLDWKHFVSDQMLDFCKEEIRAVKEYSSLPTVTNMMGTFKPLNYFKWARELDLTALDNYPFWHVEKGQEHMAMISSIALTLTRSLKKQPFLLMESVPSAVNWMPECILKRPGMHELSSLQAIAHGSDSVQYFQWRKGRGGNEKYHGAVIDHKNGGNTRVFRDVKKVGERLEAISDIVLGTCNRPKVALVFDWENWWALEDTPAVQNPFDYRRKWTDYYQVFWEMGIDVDIVDMDDPLEDYRLVVAPLNYMYRGNYIENVKRFVAAGGTYVTTYWSGEVDEHDLCFTDSHPLREMLGIRTEEIDVSPKYVHNQICYQEKDYAVQGICALVHAETAEVLATYKKDFYAGYPALTVHTYGQGKAYFIASETEISFLRELYERLVEETQTGCSLQAASPAGVTVTERKTADVPENEAKSMWFVQNFNAGEVRMELKKRYKDAESGKELEGEIALQGYQCLILQ